MRHGLKNSGKAWTKLWLGIALGGVLIAGSAAANTPPQDTPKEASAGEVAKLIADARTALKSGNYRLALIQLRNAVRIAPSSSDARIQLALVMFQTGDPSGAERELRQAWKGGAPEKAVLPILYEIMLVRHEEQELIDQFPDPGSSNTPVVPDLLRARALALQYLGRPVEALDAIDRALKLRRDARGLLARARVSLQQGDLNSARQFTDEAMRQSPDSLEIAIFRLSILKATKDGAGAMALSNRLLAKYPDNIEVKFAHIELLLDQKQDAQAKTEVDAILAKRPGVPMAIYYKALLASRAGDAKGAWDIALALQKEALEVSPDLALTVAQIAANAGRQDTAANILGRILGKDPRNQSARLKLASIYMDQDNSTSALTVLGPVKDSTDPAVLRLLERVYTQLERPSDVAAVRKKLAAATGANPQEISQGAIANIQAGRLDQAIKDLSAAVSKQPTNPVLVRPLVGALLRAQRIPEALAVADKLAADPKQRPTAMLLRGEVLLGKRDLAGAETAFNEAIKLEPGNRTALLTRADLYVLMQKYDSAGRDLRAVLDRNPKDVAVLLRLADISARQGRDADVRSNLAKAMGANPQDPAPRLSLGRYLAGRGDLKEAQEQANNLVKLQPSNAAGVELQGAIELKMGQKKEAVTSFRRLVSLVPNSAGSQVSLANALFLSGDRAGAVKALDAAIVLAPQSPAVKAAQINLQLAMGQADQAISSAQSFRSANPGMESDILAADTLVRTNHGDQAMAILSKSFADKPTRQVLSRYGRLAVMQNQDKRADDALASWLRKNPADIGARLEFANYYMVRNDVPRAVAQYDAVLKRQPDNALAMNNLGGLLQTSNPGRASELLTKAVQLAPDSADVNDSLGWLKVQQKDVAAGLSHLRRAHDLRANDPTITYHLIVALDASAKRNDARAMLKTLLASGADFPDKQAALKLSSQWR